MVAGAPGHHSSFLLRRRQRRQRVVAATEFECSHSLGVIALNENFGLHALVKSPGSHDRRVMSNAFNTFGSSDNIFVDGKDHLLFLVACLFLFEVFSGPLILLLFCHGIEIFCIC